MKTLLEHLPFLRWKSAQRWTDPMLRAYLANLNGTPVARQSGYSTRVVQSLSQVFRGAL